MTDPVQGHMLGASRVVESELGTMTPSESQYKDALDPISNVLDKDWLHHAFMIPDKAFSDNGDLLNRYNTTASRKFTDTRLGCNIGINPKPQYCQYSDVPVKGRFAGRADPGIQDTTGNYGMGRQYSEFIDDSAQRIYMTFGVPSYNSLIGFFRTAYETTQNNLARTGRAESFFYQAGTFIGGAAMLYAFPVLSVSFYIAGFITNFISGPTSKFYTLKQTMPLYWSTVDNLTRAMAINRGLMPKFVGQDEDQKQGRAFVIDNEYLAALMDLYPDLFNEQGVLSMYRVAVQAQRLADKVLREERDALSDSTSEEGILSYIKRITVGPDGGNQPAPVTPVTDDDSLTKDAGKQDNPLDQFFRFIASAENSPFIKKVEEELGMETDPRAAAVDEKGQMKPEDKAKAEKSGNGFLDATQALIRDGALFAIFHVNHTGPQSETWMNSVAESQLQSTLNGKVKDFAEARFSMAEGNIVGGIVGDVIGSITSSVADLASATMSKFTFGLSDAVQGLAGAGYIDIPKHWSDSSFQGTSATYSMQLISPYGNQFSQFMNIDIPIAMLMAGALPRSTGKSSYTAPYLCQIFDRGRCQIRLGMIESLSFTRGTSHLSFSDNGNAMCVDVNFKVTDLSSIMHMPVASGILPGKADITSDPDNILQDYLAVLTGQSINSQIYFFSKMRVKIAKAIASASRLTDGAYYAFLGANTPVFDVINWFTRQADVLDFTGGSLPVAAPATTTP